MCQLAFHWNRSIARCRGTQEKGLKYSLVTRVVEGEVLRLRLRWGGRGRRRKGKDWGYTICRIMAIATFVGLGLLQYFRAFLFFYGMGCLVILLKFLMYYNPYR